MTTSLATMPGATIPEPSDRITVSPAARLQYDGLAANVSRLASTLRAGSATTTKAEEADKLLLEMEGQVRATRLALRRGLRS